MKVVPKSKEKRKYDPASKENQRCKISKQKCEMIEEVEA